MHRAYIPRLTTALKRAAINNIRQQRRLAMVSGVPSPQVVLTPANPIQGPYCFIQMRGFWDPEDQTVALLGNGQDYICLFFALVASATYLLDVSVDSDPSMGNWDWNLGAAGSASWGQGGTLTPQQGHLLYPFIAGNPANAFNALTISLWPSQADNRYHVFYSAELTQVS
jgi:hypothetical protein